MKFTTALLASVAIVLLSGCTQHYQIHDPSTGRIYHTTKLKTLDTGAIRFTDAVSGAAVTVQNSEVNSLSRRDYDAAVNAIESAEETPVETVSP